MRWICGIVLMLSGVAAADVVSLANDTPPVRVTNVDAVAAANDQPPPRDAAWRPLALPHRWGAANPNSTTVWYRTTLRVAAWDGVDWGVYLPKASMNADLWLNGRLAARQGSMQDPVTRHWNTPLLFHVPALMLHAGDNDLALRVRAGDRHDGGLAPFQIGLASDLEPRARNAHFWHVTLVDLAVTCVLALAFVVGIMWARRRERLDYGYFSLGALGCAISALNMSVASPPLNDAAWEVLVHVALHGGVLCLALFAWQFSGKSTRQLRWYALAMVVADLVALGVLDGAAHRIAVSAVSFIAFLVAAGALIPLVQHLRRQPVTDFVVFGLAATTTVVIGAYDWLVVSGMLPYEWPYALPYIWPVAFGAFAWLVAGDYARTQRDLATLNVELAARVQAREAALQHTYEQLRSTERAHAATQERTRILRDMHDGVGAHLTTALRQLESGRSSSDDVASTLRESLDHLKLSIDGMTLPAGDVNSLLAALRYRLGKRLEGAGLTLAWNVNELPNWPDGHQEGAMRHLQFALFELVSNVLQHAAATLIDVSAAATDTSIDITIADNGRGMPQTPALRSVELRVRAIGGVLEIDAQPPGTRVRIRLTLTNVAEPTAPR